MRIICISDTHNHHSKMKYNLSDYINKNDYNVLIHAGDVSSMGYMYEVSEFINWFQNLKGFDTKIFVAGNHDFAFEQLNSPHHEGEYDWLKNLIYEENLSQSDCVYLEDSEFLITVSNINRPIKFYGSPWQPAFRNWAFNLPRNGNELELKWNNIPEDVDILITHTPPYGIGDYTMKNERVGCELLKIRLENISPLIHVYGHIHEAYGVSISDKTIYVNACTCNKRYEPNNEPQIIDITEYYGEVIATHIYAE